MTKIHELNNAPIELRVRGLVRTAVFLHQIDRSIRQLEQMRMRAIAIGHNRKPELAIAIAKQESRITWNAAAVCDVAIAIAHFRPPSQAEPGGFIAPNVFYR